MVNSNNHEDGPETSSSGLGGRGTGSSVAGFSVPVLGNQQNIEERWRGLWTNWGNLTVTEKKKSYFA